jgi:hypothetical protein
MSASAGRDSVCSRAVDRHGPRALGGAPSRLRGRSRRAICNLAFAPLEAQLASSARVLLALEAEGDGVDGDAGGVGMASRRCSVPLGRTEPARRRAPRYRRHFARRRRRFACASAPSRRAERGGPAGSGALPLSPSRALLAPARPRSTRAGQRMPQRVLLAAKGVAADLVQYEGMAPAPRLGHGPWPGACDGPVGKRVLSARRGARGDRVPS